MDKRLVIDNLLEGKDIRDLGPDNIGRARAFLSHLLDEDTKTYCMSGPIARQLMGYQGWHDAITIKSLIEFCEPRYPAFKELEKISKSVDVTSGFMIGSAIEFARISGIKVEDKII